MKRLGGSCKLLIILTFLSFLGVSAANAASYNPKLKYRTINTEHFAIHYPAYIEDVAQRAALVAEQVYDTLEPKFEWKPWGRTQMLLTDSSDDPNGMASVLPYNWIYIRVTAPRTDSSLSDFDHWLRLLIMHEYTHILQMDQVRGVWKVPRIFLGKLISPNGMTPGWIKEGLATYEETKYTKGGRGRASYSEMLIRTAILDDKFLTIDLADGDQWKWPSTYARYIYGVKFLEYLSDTYGEDKLYEFVERVSKSPLLMMINRQAKKTFSKAEMESIKVHNRYVRQRVPGAPKTKNFYKLWKDWHETLRERYQPLAEMVREEGLTPFEVVTEPTRKGHLSTPQVSPDGSFVIYTETSPYGPARLMKIDTNGENKERLLKHNYVRQVSFAPDGSYIVFAKAGSYKRYQYWNDLYKYTFETKKLKRLTKGKRAMEPDVSPDGKEIVCVTQSAGTSWLELYNIESEELTKIPIDLPQFTQFAKPRFSPNGKEIAVAVAVPGSVWDIYIYSKTGKLVRRVTDDWSLESDPIWSKNGKDLFFVSDKNGISNIYRYNIRRRKLKRITNVLTGVFKPSFSPDGNYLYVQYYDSDGYDIRRAPIGGSNYTIPKDDYKLTYTSKGKLLEKDGKKAPAVFGLYDETFWNEVGDATPARFSYLPYAKTEAAEELAYKSKKYRALGKSFLLPRFIMPNGALLDDAFYFSLMTGGADPLRWHNWLGGVTYRTDAKHVGYFARYWYNRFRTVFNVGIIDYAVEFGYLTFTYASGLTRTVHLFEKRKRAYGGLSYPMGRHAVALNYFYEDREPKTALTTAERNTLNLGIFAGFNVRYAYNDSRAYQASISREGGRRIRLGFDVTNSVLGSASHNEQYIALGDWREYIGLGRRNVIALRASGGMAWGDQLRQGTFSLGGSLGEGNLSGTGSMYYFPLRGLPMSVLSRARAMLLSAEYRLPLLSVQRGFGTLPLFVNDIHLALFADYGNTWNARENTGSYFFNNFMLGVGAELRANFVMGYGLPLEGRLGYGIIVKNRGRLGNLQDPVLKHPAKDGVLIIQFGTSF